MAKRLGKSENRIMDLLFRNRTIDWETMECPEEICLSLDRYKIKAQSLMMVLMENERLICFFMFDMSVILLKCETPTVPFLLSRIVGCKMIHCIYTHMWTTLSPNP